MHTRTTLLSICLLVMMALAGSATQAQEEPEAAMYTPCMVGEEPCTIEQAEEILRHNVIAQTVSKWIPKTTEDCRAFLTVINQQLLLDAVRFVAIQRQLDLQEAQLLFNDVLTKLRNPEEIAFLLQIRYYTNGICTYPYTVNMEATTLETDDKQIGTLTRFTPSIPVGDNGYLFFENILTEHTSSFTIWIPFVINSVDVTMSFAYDNTLIDFSSLIGTMSMGMLSQVSSARLSGESLLEVSSGLELVFGIIGLLIQLLF